MLESFSSENAALQKMQRWQHGRAAPGVKHLGSKI
jgi:hypothetical protein